jgi:hypothetical protein
MNSLALHYAQRRRVVFTSTRVPVWLDDPEPDSSRPFAGRRGRARPGRLTHPHQPALARQLTSPRLAWFASHKPFGPLAATVSRPLGDAMVAIHLLRIR